MTLKTQTPRPGGPIPTARKAEVETPAATPVNKAAPQTPKKGVDLGNLATAFVGIAHEVVNAPEAGELNQGPSQAARMAVANRAQRILASDTTPPKTDLPTQKFLGVLQNGVAGAWQEAREPMAQAAMGTLKHLASSEGSEAVKAAVKVASTSKTVMPVARVVGDAFVGSMKTVLAGSASTVATETAKAAGKAAAQEAGKAVAKEAGKAVAKEGVKAGVVGVGGSVPAIGNVINGVFALVSGVDFVASLGKAELSGGEKVGKLVKFATSTVATFLPAGGGLLSLAGGVAGGAIEGAASAHRVASEKAPEQAAPNPRMEKLLGEIRGGNAVNPQGGTELPEGTLESPAATAGVLSRLSNTLLHGGEADQHAATALKSMADILGTVTSASSLTDAQKKTLNTLSSTVNQATNEGLKGMALKAATELHKPEVAAAWGKKATEAAQGALNGLVGLHRMATGGKAGKQVSVPPQVATLATTGLQVLGKVALCAAEVTA